MIPDVLTRTFVVQNEKGLHARPATAIARALSPLDSTVTFDKAGQKVSAKSVISILILAATQGAQLQVRTSGPERQAAMDALQELFDSNFGED